MDRINRVLRRILPGASFWARLPVLAAVAMLLLWVVSALFGPMLIDPSDPVITLTRIWAPPSSAHLLGCDGLGRDILARVVLGARLALVTALGAMLAVLVVGGALGVAAGMFGGRLDASVRGLAEVTMGVPRLVLALAISPFLEPGAIAAILAFTVSSWPSVALPTRSRIDALWREEFVRASLALGGSTRHVLYRHMLPGLKTEWLAQSGGLAARAVLLEAALGVLGLGPSEPDISWGELIRDGTPMLATAPAMALSAAMAVFSVALSANLIADDLARRLDSRRHDGMV